jgi:hypothetical protein
LDHKRRVDEKYLTKAAKEEILEITNIKANNTDNNTENNTASNQIQANNQESTATDQSKDFAVIDDSRKREITDENESKREEPPLKKKKLKGRNKKRPIDKRPDNMEKLCPKVLADEHCHYGEKCKFSHDMIKFIENKPKSFSDTCYLYETFGRCQFGIACVNSSQHTMVTGDKCNQIVNEEKWCETKQKVFTTNLLEKGTQVKLWKRNYDFKAANKIVKVVEKLESNKMPDYAEINVKRPDFYYKRILGTKAENSVSNNETKLSNVTTVSSQDIGNDAKVTIDVTSNDCETAANDKDLSLDTYKTSSLSETTQSAQHSDAIATTNVQANPLSNIQENYNSLESKGNDVTHLQGDIIGTKTLDSIETEEGVIKLRPQEKRKVISLRNK